MKSQVKMKLDSLLSGSSKVLEVQQVLKTAGYLSWMAGGCVRDALLGRTAADFDLVTNASVEEIKKIFPQTVLVGEQFGVLRVLHKGEEFEIAQFRKEADYKDGRRPSLVSNATPQEDAFRRDLTVNALFYDPSEQIIYDFVDGLKDLKKKNLRAVGDPRVRFQEDHLRILRAIRFKGQLDFEWDPTLEQAILSQKQLLANVSRERIRDELSKMTGTDAWEKLPSFLVESGVLKVLFPDLQWRVDSHQSVSLQSPDSIWWEWGLWMFRSGNSWDKVLKALESLRLSNAEMKSTDQFLFWFREDWAKKSLGFLLEKSFLPGSREGFFVWRDLHPGKFKEEKRFVSLLSSLLRAPIPWVKASDLPSLKGPELGAVLKEAYHRQLSGEDASKDAAICRLQKLKKNVD